MDREDIIKMALEAHGPITDKWWDMDVAALKRFAELVKQHVQIEQMPKFEALALLVREDEREECAKVLDDMAAQDRHTNYYVVAANAIRARGETK
jgi:hemerythrin-like domain-containing protein